MSRRWSTVSRRTARSTAPAVGRHAGHAAIRAFAERFARFHEGGAQLRHVISNLAAEIDGERATATCYLLNVLTHDGKSRLLAPGRYECELVKSAGQWRFHRRVVILDHEMTLDGV
jgi:SnoaL-like domain